MNFLADENFPKFSATRLREEEYDVFRISEFQLGTDDPDVLELAVRRNRILLTFDRDFGDLIFHKGCTAPPAVLYFRFDPQYPEETFEILKTVLRDFDIIGNYTVISRRGVRQRPLP